MLIEERETSPQLRRELTLRSSIDGNQVVDGLAGLDCIDPVRHGTDVAINRARRVPGESWFPMDVRGWNISQQDPKPRVSSFERLDPNEKDTKNWRDCKRYVRLAHPGTPSERLHVLGSFCRHETRIVGRLIVVTHKAL